MVRDLDNLLKTFLVLAEHKVFGPYQKGDGTGRKIVIIREDDGSTRTVSYPKWIMEQHLGLDAQDKDQFTVDHKDYNIDNNNIDNLQIIPRKEHSTLDTRRVKLVKFKCNTCDKEFERSPRLVRDKSKKGNTGIFCGRQCAGKYSRKLQLGQIERLPVQPYLQSEYYRKKNVQAFLENLITKYGIKIA